MKKKKAHTNQLYLSLVHLGMAENCLPPMEKIFQRVESFRNNFIIFDINMNIEYPMMEEA